MIARARELYAALGWRELAAVAAAGLGIAALLAFSRPIVVLVDGERVESDVAPVTTASDRAYVPLRSIADALGAETEADAKGASPWCSAVKFCAYASATRTQRSTACRSRSSMHRFACEAAS